MAKNTQLSNLIANGQADFLARDLDGGFVDILDGTQPATGDTAITSQVVLATLSLNATSAPAASAGLLTFNSVSSGVAGNSGTATWCRFYKADHTTKVMDGSVGTGTANLVLPTTAISAGQTVSCSSLTHQVNKSTSGL